MNKKDEEIQNKLLELESVVLKECVSSPQHSLTATNQEAVELLQSAKSATAAPGKTIRQELCFFAGIGCLLTGLLMFFNHVRVGSGLLGMLGMGGGGFGLLLIPLMVGISWIIYDHKNRWAWLLSAAVTSVIIFSVLNSLVLSFPTISLLGVIMLLLPFAAGGALLLKSVGGPKAIQERLTDKEQ